MTLSLLTPIVATFVVPAAGWVLNFFVRKHIFKKFPTSSAADWLLALISFDTAAMLASQDLKRLVAWQDLHGQLPAVFFCLLLITSAGWWFTLTIVEKGFQDFKKSEKRKRKNLEEMSRIGHLVRQVAFHPVFLLFVSAVSLVFFTAVHAFVFVWTGPT